MSDSSFHSEIPDGHRFKSDSPQILLALISANFGYLVASEMTLGSFSQDFYSPFLHYGNQSSTSASSLS